MIVYLAGDIPAFVMLGLLKKEELEKEEEWQIAIFTYVNLSYNIYIAMLYTNSIGNQL